jgi:hypothetical protein
MQSWRSYLPANAQRCPAPIKLLLSYKTAVSTLFVMGASKNIHTPKIEIQELDMSVFTFLLCHRDGCMLLLKELVVS